MTRPCTLERRRILPWAVGVLVAVLLGCGPSAGGPAPGSDPSPEPAGGVEPAGDGPARRLLGEGFVVWESNRSGAWRIWTQRLDGTGLRQLTPDEPGRQHCCPHLAPDGTRMVYLSRVAPADRYPEEEAPGELRLLRLHPEAEDGDAGARPRAGTVLADAARTYGAGNRAAVWRSPDELLYVGGDGRTRLLELAPRADARDGGGVVTGSRALTAEAPDTGGWLLDATLAHATTGAPTFSVYDAESRSVLERRELSGCEPYFSHDGRWGFWVPGAGGPIDRIDLATREVSTLLDKSDPRLGEKGYLYFPMLSRDGRAFAFGASDDAHSHFESDYDVFVAPTDPETFRLLARPVRVTDHPATDRYPDVFLTAPGPGWKEAEPLRAADSGAPGDAGRGVEHEGGPDGWPVVRDALAFLWRTGDSPNLVAVGGEGRLRAFSPEPRGRARLDHHHRMVLDRGAYAAPREAARHLLEAAVASNELTIEATLVPARASFDGSGPVRRIVTFSSDGNRRNFTLGQRGGRLVFRVERGVDPEGWLSLFELEPGAPVHVAVTYSPGRLTAYRNGERAFSSDRVRSSFSIDWEARELLFGDEAGGGADWRGTLEGIALHARELAPETVRRSAESYRELRDARKEVERWRVTGRLLDVSEVPTLRQISPYRRALAVHEYRVVDGPGAGSAGEPGAPAGTIRVARWVLLDGQTQPEASHAPGREETLVLERFDDNPQLAEVYVSDTLPAGDGSGREGAPLYYAVEP